MSSSSLLIVVKTLRILISGVSSTSSVIGLLPLDFSVEDSGREDSGSVVVVWICGIWIIGIWIVGVSGFPSLTLPLDQFQTQNLQFRAQLVVVVVYCHSHCHSDPLTAWILGRLQFLTLYFEPQCIAAAFSPPHDVLDPQDHHASAS